MSANIFNSVQVSRPSQNTFNLSHDVKLSMNMGNLVPILVQECIPGDKHRIRSESLIRFAPLVAPVMHNINVFIHYFFVPNRLVWDGWEKFISPDNKEAPPAPPTFNITSSISAGTLSDYLGLPVGVNSIGRVSAIPHAAYQCIWNEYYRDQNLQNEFDYKLNNGTNSLTPYLSLRKRAWQHDYFTAALPFAQKGPAVSIPMETSGYAEVVRYRDNASATQLTTSVGSDNVPVPTLNPPIPGLTLGRMYADFRSDNITNSGTINDLRVAMRLQEWYEKLARGGSRYVEQLQVMFDVRPQDYRLQRPEFIGGTRNPVIISEVLQTSETADSPQATMAGHGLAANSGKSFSYYCHEHGYIIGIMSIMPTTAYYQGIPKHFLRQTELDYAWPTFAHIGEQEVLNKELYVANDGLNDGTFGYLPRYAEYRYNPSMVRGEFRTTLDFWHMARKFENRPLLNADFIQANPTDRIFAVLEENYDQHLWCHVFNKITSRRKLPKYGTPTL